MKTILITGVSSGLGRAIAQEALARGHRVVGTVRQERQRREFEEAAPGRSIGRILDLAETAEIAPLVSSVEDECGGIDTLVNNAGYGLRGVVEELDLDALRRQFEVNVFAQVAMMQAVLPGMRRRRAGHIVNMASMGGMVAFPALGAYHATKFAMMGINDSLAQEVSPLGIRVTAVLPGLYDTDWRGRSQAHAERRFTDYDALLARDQDLAWGDPAALGQVVLDAIEIETPPQHLLVGPSALAIVRGRLSEWGKGQLRDTLQPIRKQGGDHARPVRTPDRDHGVTSRRKTSTDGRGGPDQAGGRNGGGSHSGGAGREPRRDGMDRYGRTRPRRCPSELNGVAICPGNSPSLSAARCPFGRQASCPTRNSVLRRSRSQKP